MSSFISFSMYGCGKPVIEQQPVGQEDKKILDKTYYKKPVKQPDRYSIKQPEQPFLKQPPKHIGTKLRYPMDKLSEYEYPDFTRDIHGKAGLKRALKQSIIYYGKVPSSKLFYFGEDKYDARHMKLSLQRFLDFLEKSPSTKDIRNFIHKNYNVYTTVRRSPWQRDESSSLDQANPTNTSKSKTAAGQFKTTAGQSKAVAAQSKRFALQPSQVMEDPDPDLSVLFTGYYEPSLKGSLVKEGEYIYPIYSKPTDLITVSRGGFSGKYKGTPASGARRNGKNELVPYYTRAEIDSLKGYEKRAKPLAWVNCRIDRFFLEIQGSGRVELKQGGTLRVQYHSKNGRPYRSIGKYLVDRGEMTKEEVSMQSIRKWLNKNPSRVDEVLNHNLSFVFFREGNGGPVGCLGVEVTQMRSIATDVSILPKGALGFMETTIPSWGSSEDNISWQNHSVFVLNQDTGGAIKGSTRADYFCGSGKYAELAAGYMKQMGRLYFLVLKR
ncbi:MAG: MltA domain-containing protein [Desulfamplus sp.]|nr:MltA domain-containing protein [Desulfamplus sp.]